MEATLAQEVTPIQEFPIIDYPDLEKHAAVQLEASVKQRSRQAISEFNTSKDPERRVKLAEALADTRHLFDDSDAETPALKKILVDERHRRARAASVLHAENLTLQFALHAELARINK